MCRKLTSSTWFAVLIVLVVHGMAHAQTKEADFEEPPPSTVNWEKQISRWRPGFQLGVNVTSYSTTPNVNTSAQVGYLAGIQVEYRVSPGWALQPEIRVQRKGFSYQTATNGVTDELDAQVFYLELPLLVKAKFKVGQRIQPFVFLGPNVGFKVGSNVDQMRNGSLVQGPPLTVLFHTVDFALDGGVGLEYQFAQQMAGFASARGSWGLVNVSEISGTDWKSRNFQVIFGGLFNL